MDRWRDLFAKASGDIWTVIEKAIILAATDYPKEFKNRRNDIAETLFARSLLQSQSEDMDATRLSGSLVINTTNVENVLRNDEERTEHTQEIFGVQQERHHRSDGDAAVLTDEKKEETLLLKEISRIKETLTEPDQSETILIDSLQRLEYLQVTVELLKATELGKLVNGFRKYPSKRVQLFVKRLVRRWRDLVDEWVKTAGDVAAAAIAGTKDGGLLEIHTEAHGLPLPPHAEGASLTARTTSSEMPQFLSFVDDKPGCGHTTGQEDKSFRAVNLSTRDNLSPSSKLDSMVMQTDYRKCDAEASMSNSDGGIRVLKERGSTNRVEYRGFNKLERKPGFDSRNITSQNASDQKEVNQSLLLAGKKSIDSNGPGRPANDMLNISASACSLGSGRPVRSHDSQGISKQKAGSGDDIQEAQKFELTKRKLHDGYQQAENAKKQRTVQLVGLTDLPKDGTKSRKAKFVKPK